MVDNLKALRKIKKVLPNSQRQLYTQSQYEHDKYYNQLCSMKSDQVYFDRLSDEILLNIFKWLPRPYMLKYSLVCKRWYRLMEDESLWKYHDLSSKKISVELLIKLLNKGLVILSAGNCDFRASFKKRITQNAQINTIETQLEFHLNSIIKLEIVDFTGCTLTTNALNLILKTTKYLKKISLEALELDTETCLYLSYNRQLDTLNLANCTGITYDGLVNLVHNLKKLSSLNLAWTSLNRESIILLCSYLPITIEKFNISGCRTTLLDDDIYSLCNTCPNLKELDISDAHSLTNYSIDIISSRLFNLEYIALSRCYSILPAAYLSLSNISSLIAIDAFNILKDKSIDLLKESMQQLQFVNRYPFSSIARPTCGFRRTSIWGCHVKDEYIRLK